MRRSTSHASNPVPAGHRWYCFLMNGTLPCVRPADPALARAAAACSPQTLQRRRATDRRPTIRNDSVRFRADLAGVAAIRRYASSAHIAHHVRNPGRVHRPGSADGHRPHVPRSGRHRSQSTANSCQSWIAPSAASATATRLARSQRGSTCPSAVTGTHPHAERLLAASSRSRRPTACRAPHMGWFISGRIRSS